MQKIRLGLFGLGRGSAFYNVVKANGGEIVAVCEKREGRCKGAKEFWGENLAVYSDFDEFIKHDMDAVFLCNCFHEHAPYAIKCMEKGIPVLSECTAAGTLAEAVELVRAYEKYGTMYMLSENYPFMLFNQEMRKVYRGGTLGDVIFAEGEYNHPGNPKSPLNDDVIKTLRGYEKHWRNYLPRTYYLTHSLAPLMWITGKMPRKVTAAAVYKPDITRGLHCGDAAAFMLVTNDDNSVFRVCGNTGFGCREDSYRICGTKGQIENVRKAWNWDNEVILNYNEWNVPEGMKEHNRYIPKHESEADRLEAEKAGHGGGDYYVIKEFFRCIREKITPDMDVYFAATISVVGILGFRSILEGKSFDIPDMKKEEERKIFENDRETPFWGTDGSEPTIRCCSDPDYKAPQEVVDRYMKAITSPWSDGKPYIHMG